MVDSSIGHLNIMIEEVRKLDVSPVVEAHLFTKVVKCFLQLWKAQVVQGVWVRYWPKYCRECDATGVYESGGDSVDYGSTTATLPTWSEPCPKCTEQGVCPRCHSSLGCTEQELILVLELDLCCMKCGWNWDKPTADCWHDALPFIPECSCWHHIERKVRVSMYGPPPGDGK